MITARWRRVAKHDTMQRVSPEGTRRMGQCAGERRAGGPGWNGEELCHILCQLN